MLRSLPLKFKKLSSKGKAPFRGSEFAAGYDLHAAEDMVIPAKGKALVGTGLAFEIPVGTYGRLGSLD